MLIRRVDGIGLLVIHAGGDARQRRHSRRRLRTRERAPRLDAASMATSAGHFAGGAVAGNGAFAVGLSWFSFSHNIEACTRS